MAGAGLAVSLAYLALERFRYRSSIEWHAGQKKRQFATANDHDTVEVVKDLQWLCRAESNGHTPRGFGANFYHYAFRNKADEILIAFLACLAGFTLVTGVGITSNVWTWAKAIDTPRVAATLFYACFGALGLPAIAVLCGRRSVRWGRNFADHCEREITKIHQQSARAAVAPVPPSGPGVSGNTLRRLREAQALDRARRERGE